MLGVILAACGAELTPTSQLPAASVTLTPTPTVAPATKTPTPTIEPTATPTTPPAATATPVPGSQSVAALGPGTVQVDILNSTHQTLTIQAGTTLIWTNRDPVPHSSASGETPNPDGIWISKILKPGEATAPVTLDKVGTFPYFCQVHPSIKATITVVAAAGGAASLGIDSSAHGHSRASSDSHP